MEENIIRTRPSPDCYLCGVTGISLYEALQDRIFGASGAWNLKKCPNPDCGLVWLDPMPLEKDIGKAYDTYYTHSGSQRERWGYWLLRVSMARITGHRRMQRRISYMTLEGSKPGRLLEVGCGAGEFLQRMHAIGWQVEGVDIDAKAVEQARRSGFAVQHGDLASGEYPEGRFDAIAMNHVIEHLFNPIAVLEECRRLLKPDGRIVVVTPNILSRGHLKFQSCWRGLEPPRHIHLFSPLTLRDCAKRAGFNNIETWSTAANAAGIWTGSIDMQMKGKHDMRANPSIQVFLRSYVGLYQEYFALRQHPDGGEEAVLIASK